MSAHVNYIMRRTILVSLVPRPHPSAGHLIMTSFVGGKGSGTDPFSPPNDIIANIKIKARKW